MRKFFSRLDQTALINTENARAAWLERAAFIFLALMVLAAPHSIAATQTAWILGMLAWIARLFIKPRPALVRTPLDAALWAFFGWSAVTSVFSYAPVISLDKLRGVALFLIFYFVVNVVRTKRAAVFLTLALVASCMVNVLLVPIERLIGRGVEIHGVRPESPLAEALLMEGDALLKANGKKIKTPEELVAEIERGDSTKIEFYRPDFYYAVEVKRENLLGGTNALERLGIENWRRSHNWRSTGFFGHWTTYGEVLQLIASLAFGLLIALIGGRNFSTRKRKDAEKTENSDAQSENSASARPLRIPVLLLLFSLGAMLFALLLNGTRASQGGLMISAFAIVLLSRSRKIILAFAAIAVPLVVAGSIYLQQSRNVGFVDQKDESTRYRQTMYRDGLRLWTESPRHFILGVGMDSIKKYWREWNLFEGGNLPVGHFHSTPLQLAVERGLPSLLLWLWILWLYARMLIRGISDYRHRNTKNTQSEPSSSKSKIELGVLLGVFGGFLGFAASGLVHYNLGDQEVAMIFFLLMGLSFVLVRRAPIYRADSVRA